MSGKLRASSDADGTTARRVKVSSDAASESAEGEVPAAKRFDTAELAKRPLAYPKEFIYSFFMAHEGALLAVTVVGVVAGVLLLVWFLAFSGMNEPVQFIYDSF